MLRSCFGGLAHLMSEGYGFSIGGFFNRGNSGKMTNPEERPKPGIESGTAKLEKAIAGLTEAIQNGNDNAEMFISRATCHIKLSNFYKALEDAKEARLRGEQSVNLALIGGDAAVNLSKMEDACSFYTMGLKVDPTNTSVIDRLQMLQEMILPDYDLEGGCDSDQGYSAVTLFNQEPYPGDDELISKEKQTILAKFCLEDTEPWKENVEDAEKQRASNIAMGAHEFMVDNKLEDALKEYTLAVKADPGNSILRRLRAEVLYILDDKYAALRELWAVPTEKKSLDVWKF